jgi:hypothetical protein
VNTALPTLYEPAAAMSVMLVLLLSRASSQFAELDGPRPLGKGLCADPFGTLPLQTGSAVATPAKPSELTANAPATSSVFANETILTMVFVFP